MTRISRRSLLAAGTLGATLDAIPFSAWIKQQAWAQGTRVRYNAYSTQGKAMLQKYEAGVSRMMNTSLTPEASPLSWTFQWYTHFVRGDKTKASELMRIYPSQSGPNFALAQLMWDTCHSHNGQPEDFFLPWHRIFVYYFEMIVRQASYEPSFTLPYWNYSNPAQAAIPPEFAVTTSPLYRSSRNPGVNTGSKIPASLVALTALQDKTYSPSGVDQGFCADLDFGLHGNVHVWVGNNQGMGSVPWAANDPIFWMHHCNVDRLWASWNRGKCKNPTYAAWLNQQFVFADISGNKVVATVKDFNDISQANYTYDAFESASCPITPIVRINPVVLATVASQLELARTPTRVNLVRTAAPPTAGAQAPALREQIKALAPTQNVYLLLQNVMAEAPVGVVYDVYLDPPQGATLSTDSPNYVGTINFFAVTMSSEMTAMKPRDFSLNVTDKVKDINLTETPAVTLVPQGEPNEAAKPMIGKIELVSQ